MSIFKAIKKIGILVAFCAIIFAKSISVCAQQETTDYSMLKKDLGIDFKSPSGWAVDESAIIKYELYWTDPEKQATISLVRNWELGTDETEFDASLLTYKKKLEKGTRNFSGMVTNLFGVECHIYKYTLHQDHPLLSRDNPRLVINYIFMKNDTPFDILFLARENIFDQYLSVFDEFINSIKITETINEPNGR
jgi:hypothetical protein